MRPAEQRDAKAVTELANLCFGDAYTSLEEMKGFIEDRENRLFIEEDEKGLAGAVLFLKDDKEGLFEDLDVTGDDFDRLSEGKKVLHHKFSIIREDLRGKGIMTRMLDDAIALVEDSGSYGVIFTQGWIKQGSIPMENIFKRAGYRVYKKQIRPWWKYNDRTCNICGGRCRCDAMVYYRKL